MTIACVGIAVWDLVLAVAEFPQRPGKYRATRRFEVGGGVAANAAVTIVRLGGAARFFGRVGDDPVGGRIVADLGARGVDVAGVRHVSGAMSPLSVVLLDTGGERLIVNHASDDLFEGGGPDGLEGGDVDAVLADMRWHTGARAALDAGRDAGVPAILDCDHDPAGKEDLLEASTDVVFSLPTLQAYTGARDPDAALRRAAGVTDAWLAATDGAAGVYWRDGDTTRHLPAFPVAVVDTLGAGDVFHGAFALARAEGETRPDALRWAAAAAALKCATPGGRDGIPDRTGVDAFLRERDR